MSELLWQRWDDIDRLLSEALDLPQAERAEYIRRQTPEDGPFQELLLRLLHRLETDAGSMTPPESLVTAAFGPGMVEDAATDLATGTMIGRYRIVTRRARGGMAIVYEAERSDGVYRQRVALKVLRRGLDTDDLIRRFLTERQILSSLSHPNIAKLLDGGSTPDGRPFLVMELVEGRPITEYADQRRLEIQSRLALFLGVVDAVHAAHRQLVVHRDIKPSNILVDDEGRVKLLDFGIAKLLDEEGEHTRAGARALTPEYASPEQLRGDPVTTATDVYQLGLLLRELLTGVRAVGPGLGEPPVRASRLATRAAPSLPGSYARAEARATTPTRLARRLRGDLDIIVAKALRPEPEQRYASADELAADVRRHLGRLPILAHRESAAYRTRKWIQRHTWAAGALAAGLVFLVGYAVTTTVQSRRIASERDRAAQEARKAGQVTDFLLQLFDAADPNREGAQEITARELLQQGASRLNAEAVEDPAVRAAMRAAIGRSYNRLGLYQEAEHHLDRAVAAQRQLPADESLARYLNLLGNVVKLRDRDSARGLFEEAVSVAERSLGPDHATVGVLLKDFAIALSYRDPASPRVRELVERSLAILRAAPGDVRGELAQALLASSYGREPEVALPRMKEALGLLRDVHGERHTAVAAALSDLALATEQVDVLAADSLMEQSLQILISIHGRRHATLLTTMGNLAALRRDRGAYAAAEPLYREALALRRELYPEQRIQQSYSLYGLGRVLVETGKIEEGEVRLREALAILEAEGPAPLVALTKVAIGHALTRRRRYAEAERVLLPASEAVLAAPMTPPDKALALQRLVELYQDWPRPETAKRFQQRLDSLRSAHDLDGEFPAAR